MHPKKALRAAALGIALAAAPQLAQAATLRTNPMVTFQADPNDAYLYCQIRNVSSKPIKVTIEGMGYLSELISTSSKTLEAGQAVSMPAGDGFITSCRFTVAGNARKVRAAAIYFNGSDFVHAIPAR